MRAFLCRTARTAATAWRPPGAMRALSGTAAGTERVAAPLTGEHGRMAFLAPSVRSLGPVFPGSFGWPRFSVSRSSHRSSIGAAAEPSNAAAVLWASRQAVLALAKTATPVSVIAGPVHRATVRATNVKVRYFAASICSDAVSRPRRSHRRRRHRPATGTFRESEVAAGGRRGRQNGGATRSCDIFRSRHPPPLGGGDSHTTPGLTLSPTGSKPVQPMPRGASWRRAASMITLPLIPPPSRSPRVPRVPPGRGRHLYWRVRLRPSRLRATR